MFALAVTFTDVALAAHIVFVVAALGTPVADPVIARLVERVDRGAVPAFHRVRKLTGRFLVNPVLLLVLIAGTVLAAREHAWTHFFVQWGIGAMLVLGGLEGSYVMPRSGRLGELAARDLAAGAGEWSEEYLALRARVRAVSAVMALLVLATVAIMAIKPGT